MSICPRTILEQLAQAILDAQDALWGAARGERAPQRASRRKRYRFRPWDMSGRTIGSALPRLREGSYVPDLLVSPHQCFEPVLAVAIADTSALAPILDVCRDESSPSRMQASAAIPDALVVSGRT